MRKILLFSILLVATLALGAVIFFYSSLSGGIMGVWYDFTKPTLDPLSPKVVQKRELVKNHIVTEFDYIDSLSILTKYGVHNADICTKAEYGWKNPISIFDKLYECKYISQRYYGFDGDYEDSVRQLMKSITDNNQGLSFQPYQTEQLFVQKDWMTDGPTIKKILASHNLKNKNKPYTNIYEVVSFIEGQNMSTVYPYSLSTDGYAAQLDFFDWGAKPSATLSSDFFETHDVPDLRSQYVEDINKKHKFGVVVTITKVYFKK